MFCFRISVTDQRRVCAIMTIIATTIIVPTVSRGEHLTAESRVVNVVWQRYVVK